MLTASLQRVNPPPTHHECLEYNTKPPDGVAPILELWGIWSTPSLSLLPGLLWAGVVVPVRVPCQKELFDHLTVCKQMTDVKLNCEYYMAILSPIYQCAYKWVVLNSKQYLKPFNCAKKWSVAHLKILPTNCLQILYIQYV